MTFYERLDKLCVSAGVSPHGLCKELGIARSSPSSWKRGINPSNKTAKLLAEYFGVSIEYILGGEEISNSHIDYSKRLTILRSRMGWTQEELGANLGISQKMISAIEMGTRKPSSVVMLRIDGLLEECADVSKAFGVGDPKDLDKDFRFPPNPIRPSGPCEESVISRDIATKDDEISSLKERILELKHTIEIQQELIEKLKNGKPSARVVDMAGVGKSKSLVRAK